MTFHSRRFRVSLLLFAILVLSGETLSAASGPFDPHADPEADLAAAKVKAQADHRNIWVDIGANWCPGCVSLDKQIMADPHLYIRLYGGYEVMRINMRAFRTTRSAKAVLAPYPNFRTIPHILILDPHGNFLHAVDPEDLLSDKKHDVYNQKLFVKLLEDWTLDDKDRARSRQALSEPAP